MGDRMKKTAGRFKEFTGKMSKGLKRGIIFGLIIAILAVAGLLFYRSSRPYTVLFRELSQEDMTNILTYLNENNVTDIQIQNNNTILVRAEQEASLKAAIIQQGYPSSGYAYDTYLNNIGILSSETDRRQLTVYDLQDQLADVIRRFDGVSDARVNINTASNNRYILSDSVVDATASVFIDMKSGRTLSDSQVKGIRSYVSHAVSGLDFSNVTIQDGSGTQYTGTDDNGLRDNASLKLSLQSQIDNDKRNKILSELIPLFGMENVNVSVTSTVDVTHSYSEAVTYNEPDWAQENVNG